MIALLVVLAGCGGALPAASVSIADGSPEMRQLDAIVQAWSEIDGLRPLNASKLRALRVIDAETREEFERLCRRSDGNGCTRYRQDGTYAVVAPANADGSAISAGSRLSVIRHEAVHFAANVSGMGSDPYHTSRVLWGYHCGRALACRALTVEDRARSIATGAR